MTRKFPSVSRSARLVLLGGLAWSGISFASPPDEPKPSESTAAEADVAQPAPDPYLTTAPPTGYETFVDAQGRRYFVLTVRKKEGAFVRVGTTHVQFKGGYVLEIDSETDDELRVTLAPQSSPHRTRAIAALCEELNRTSTRFPGTRLTLRFAIHQPVAEVAG